MLVAGCLRARSAGKGLDYGGMRRRNGSYSNVHDDKAIEIVALGLGDGHDGGRQAPAERVGREKQRKWWSDATTFTTKQIQQQSEQGGDDRTCMIGMPAKLFGEY